MTRLSTSRNSQQIYKPFTSVFSAALSALCWLELPCAKQVTAHIVQVMLQQQISINVVVIILSLLFSKSFSVSNINSTWVTINTEPCYVDNRWGKPKYSEKSLRHCLCHGTFPKTNSLKKKDVTRNSDKYWWRSVLFSRLFLNNPFR